MRLLASSLLQAAERAPLSVLAQAAQVNSALADQFRYLTRLMRQVIYQ